LGDEEDEANLNDLLDEEDLLEEEPVSKENWKEDEEFI